MGDKTADGLVLALKAGAGIVSGDIAGTSAFSYSFSYRGMSSLYIKMRQDKMNAPVPAAIQKGSSLSSDMIRHPSVTDAETTMKLRAHIPRISSY